MSTKLKRRIISFATSTLQVTVVLYTVASYDSKRIISRLVLQSDLVAAFKGEGTAYSDMVESGIGFACSYRHFSDPTKKYFAAINSAQWDNGKNCGKCVKAWCVDDFCTVKNEPVTVMIVDKCPECAHGDLDFSIPAYREVRTVFLLSGNETPISVLL